MARRSVPIAAAAVALVGCSGTGHTASVATNISPFSTPASLPPVVSASAPPSAQASAVVQATSAGAAPGSASSAPPGTGSFSAPPPPSAPASTDAGDSGEFSSPTPCPVPSPQVFVEGKSASRQADGTIVFNYRAADRLCGGPDDGQYVTTGTRLLTARVDPSATVLLLPPDVNTPHQVVVDALPDAMASNNQAPYYALTFDSTGSITRIEQYFHP
jgi:hypothetical protein